MAQDKWRQFFDYEYRPGEELVVRFRRPALELIPKEVRTHLLAAQKELLLAMRSFVDTVIERMEEREQRRGRRKQIRVE